MSDIILSTLNARYIHSSLGLRYLKANMDELIDETLILEFIINNRPIDIAESILKHNPKIVGFGLYIWNAEQTTQVVSLLKTIQPEIIVVIGGPEASFEHDKQKIVELADYVISGTADLAFAELCKTLLKNNKQDISFNCGSTGIIKADPVPLPFLKLPYSFYSDEDVKNRVIYVEASRGCPFKCEFCLSSLDKTAWPFELDLFLKEMETLYDRGVRDFKFIDRTFNLKIKSSIQILEFFLERMDENLYLHFELIPDHLPEKLKNIIHKFPEGSLQFEIGVQTFNPEVQALISRKQDNEKSKNNIRWLREESHAHLHTDIIMGLPGESVESIASSFNQLIALNPHEIQMGILKRLRGTPLIRHTETYDMRYNPEAPYNILSTNLIDFHTMQRLNRFARFWDMIANSGRFTYTLPIILGNDGFNRFIKLSDQLFETSGQTYKISLARLFEMLFSILKDKLRIEENSVREVLWKDYLTSGLKGRPTFATLEMIKDRQLKLVTPEGDMPNRQARHAKTLKNA